LVGQFKILILKNAIKVLVNFEIEENSDYFPMDSRVVFKAALKADASEIILA